MEDFYKCVFNKLTVKEGSLKNAIEAMRVVEEIYNLDITWKRK